MQIRPKDRDTLVQALSAGVVPRTGLHHVQVGRVPEVKEILKDIGRIRDGGTAVRFIIGDYGSGKTFFLHLARTVAIKEGLVTAHADLSPRHRLHATGGQARSLYANLMNSLATGSRPEGGALTSIVERFINDAGKNAAEQGRPVGALIRERLATLRDLVGGYDLATVLTRYYEAFESGNDNLKAAALRWLKGEFATRTEASQAGLGVRSIIDDATIYEHLRLMARFVRLAGYNGLLVVLDEMVNVFKIVNAQARNANYELILRIVNDMLQGNAEYVGIFFSGTPEFLTHDRRGAYSYRALRSRLEPPPVPKGLVNMAGPVLELESLTTEELYVLLENLRHIFAYGDPMRYLVPSEALDAFMAHCSRKIGDAYFRTPRTTIRSFLGLLAILEQNPGTTWQELVPQVPVDEDRPPVEPDIVDDELASFRLT